MNKKTFDKIKAGLDQALEHARRPVTEPESLISRLRTRATIRRGIASRKSVQEGKPDRIADLLDEAAQEIEERDFSFDLRWNADMRAIKRWQAAHPGNDLTWPDHADLVVWLMEQLDAVNNAVAHVVEEKP